MDRRALILLVPVLVLGCKKSPAEHVKDLPPATLAQGWTWAEDKESGVGLGVPSGWRVGSGGSMDALGLAQDMPTEQSNNPDLQALTSRMKEQNEAQEQQALAELKKKGIVINCVDSSKPIPGEERTRFYLKVVPHDGNLSLSEASQDEQDVMKKYGGKAEQKIQLPIGPAAKYVAEMKTRGGDTVNKISYVVADGSKSYVLRFISTNNPQAIQSVADDVAKSLRIKPSKD